MLEDAKPYARMKLMIVGVQGIGKTSLLEQLRAEGTGSYKKRPPEVRLNVSVSVSVSDVTVSVSMSVSVSDVGQRSVM